MSTGDLRIVLALSVVCAMGKYLRSQQRHQGGVCAADAKELNGRAALCGRSGAESED